LSRTIPVSVQAKLDQRLSTFACCWKLTRKDGQVMRFTSHHSDLTIDGETYLKNTGIIPSTLKQSVSTGVDNLTISGILSYAEITVKDILAERYDFAEVEFFLADYLLPGAGKIAPMKGSLGETQAKGRSFEAEFRFLIDRLSRKLVELTSRDCRCFDFCDARCGLTKATYTVSSSVSSGITPSRYLFRGTGSPLTSKPDGWFAHGELVWTSGENIGIKSEVKTFETGTGEIELQRALIYPVAIGDAFDVVAGCDRRFETCRDKFDNVINIQAEPHIRGSDYMIRGVIRNDG
jgi:uncharacterized phage protein (TIGR02218 family)